jgi:hypothetical protein
VVLADYATWMEREVEPKKKNIKKRRWTLPKYSFDVGGKTFRDVRKFVLASQNVL